MNTRGLQLALPDDLAAEVETRLRRGEFESPEDLIEASLRYYLERHDQEAWASYIREEIQAGLHEPS